MLLPVAETTAMRQLALTAATRVLVRQLSSSGGTRPAGPTRGSDMSLYHPMDPEAHLRTVAADTRRMMAENHRRRALRDSDGNGHGPRRIRFRRW
jgi:hypothetical protein